jgi:hypothetical protein
LQAEGLGFDPPILHQVDENVTKAASAGVAPTSPNSTDGISSISRRLTDVLRALAENDKNGGAARERRRALQATQIRAVSLERSAEEITRRR